MAKNNVLFTLSVIFIFLLVSSVASSDVIRNVEISVILDNPKPGEEYDSLFRVENLDHVSGTTDLLHFSINASLYNISINDSISSNNSYVVLGENFSKTLYFSWNKSRSINKFTQSGMGSLSLEEGVYELCVSLTPLNFIDHNTSNLWDCKIIATQGLNVSNVSYFEPIVDNTSSYNNKSDFSENVSVSMCDCSLDLFLEKDVYEKGESVSFIIRDCWDNSSFKYPVKYWVEDLFGEITKTKLKTSSKAPKSYTPRFDSLEKSFFLKAKISGCNNTYSKAFSFKDADPKIKETELIISTVDSASFGEVIFLDIEGHKGSTLKSLVDVFLEREGKRKSDVLKFYISRQNQDFNFRLPFMIPEDIPSGLHEYDLVFEGLGLKKSLPILIKGSDVLDEDIFSINNVYTRKQNFDGSLNVLVSWDAPEGSFLRAYSSIGSFNKPANMSPSSIPVNISYPDELVVVELVFEGKVRDVSFLKLNLSNSDELIFFEDCEDFCEKNFSNEKLCADFEVFNSSLNTSMSQSNVSINDSNDNLEDVDTFEVDAEESSLFFSFFSFDREYLFFVLAFISILFLFKKEILSLAKKK